MAKYRFLSGAAALLCLLILLAACAPAQKEQADGLYDGYITDADVFIDVPNLRQYGDYTCGATCVQMLMNWQFPYSWDINLTRYEELLGTTPETGTAPESILHIFEQQGVQVSARENMTTAELAKALKQGHPVLMCLQAWSGAEDGAYQTEDPTDTETYLAEGHWVICVGYKKTDAGYRFFFNDPACVGHTLLEEEELDARWIDMDGSGNIYDHYGMEITGETDFNPAGVFHMD